MDKSYGSPRWTQEIMDCSMPMTFDQYSNCTFGCVYCFSQFQRGIGGAKEDYLGKIVNSVDVEKVKRIFTVPNSSQFWTYVKYKKWMQWGGLSDPFDPIERKYGVGLELLKFFKSINYPICFSTKATWWLDDARYTDLFKDQNNWNVKVSIITLDERKAKAVEVGVPSPEERLKAIRKIADLNAGGATLRLRPFIIGVSNPTHGELIRRAGEAGATAVSTEFFCLELRSASLKQKLLSLKNIIGFDIFKMYKMYSSGSGYLRLNKNAKRKFIDEMQEAAHKAGMRFHVSDSHFKERGDTGSCCGLGDKCNYSRGQLTEALVIAKKEGTVNWNRIGDHLGYAKEFLWRKAAGFNTNSSERRAKFFNFTMYDYMKFLWNNPDEGQSPYKIFGGILKPISKDLDGNLVYQYDKSKE